MDYELIAGSVYFDKEWYQKEYENELGNWDKDLEYHYLERGWLEGKNPSPLFDSNRYKILYLRNNEYSDWNPLIHYEKIGKYKKIVPPLTPYMLIKKSKYFNAKWYVKEYGILCDPIKHYLNIGWKHGKNPGKYFDGDKYLEKYEGVAKAKINPLVHYERNGKYEGRVIFPTEMPVYETKGKMWKSVQQIIVSSKKRTSSKIKVAVIFHLFYPNAWEEITCYLDNLKCYDTTIYVTYPDDIDENEINEIKEDASEHYEKIFFTPCENKGFDVGPFFEMVKKINFDEYDIVFKLHSKGIKRPEIYMYGQYMKRKEWFTTLFRGCVGLFNTHLSIDKLKRKKVGMVAARNLIVKDPKHKRNLTRAWCEQLGLRYTDNYSFVAGTCFAMRAELLESMKRELTIGIDDFSETTRGEFSLAHALERYICMMVDLDGYKIKGNLVLNSKTLIRKIQAFKRKKYSSNKLLKDKRVIYDDNFFYRIIESRQIESYEVTEIKLGEILRIWKGKKVKLTECAPYRYLAGYHHEYYDYCDIHEKENLPEMTKQRFDTLISSIESNGFDDRYKIVINQDNVLQDGQHRACYLLYRYGEDHPVDVVRIHYRGQGGSV